MTAAYKNLSSSFGFASSNDVYLRVENPNAGKAAGLELLANQDSSRIHFGNTANNAQGRIYYYSPNHASQADEMEIYTSGSLAMKIKPGIGSNHSFGGKKVLKNAPKVCSSMQVCFFFGSKLRRSQLKNCGISEI